MSTRSTRPAPARGRRRECAPSATSTLSTAVLGWQRHMGVPHLRLDMVLEVGRRHRADHGRRLARRWRLVLVPSEHAVTAKFRLTRNPITRQWRFKLLAGNGECIATSESYRSKADCLHAVDVIKAVAANAPVVKW